MKKTKTLISLLFCLYGLNANAAYVTDWLNSISESLSNLFSTNSSFTPSRATGSGTINPIVRPCPASRPESYQRLEEEEQLYTAAGFEVIQSQLVETGIISQNPDINFTHELTMDSIRLEGAGFSEQQVMERMQAAAEVFKQCGVALTSYKLTSIHPLQDNQGRDIVNVTRGSPESQSIYTTRLPRADRPAMFFLNDTGNDNNAFAAYGAGPNNNTSFVSTDILRETRVERVGNTTRTTLGSAELDPNLNFSVVAHELYHLFCRCGHYEGEGPNLMVESNDRNNYQGLLTPEQCEVMKRSPLIDEL